ncbi:phytase [Simiduia curdlanivorans]|uniref:Phytase n=1 Tax=Simiduia curdlanivorans TaxID=1492769 RepID=A0ABV8V9I6_9GAMM|nr:phytase [Simiduia curdlanivorans]MDN3639503.1 phytase [Simiduia curdlanivorans]
MRICWIVLAALSGLVMACNTGHYKSLALEASTDTLALQQWHLNGGQLVLVKDGLVWHKDKAQHRVDGEFTSLDVRYPFVAGVAEGGHHLQVWQITEAGLQAQSQVLFADILADEQCLYLSRQSGQLFSFIQDGRGASQQWLLAETGQVLAKPLRVRDLPVPNGTGLCTADDARGFVFLVEEGQGIWRLPAEPEALPARRPVLLNEPFGELTGDIEALVSLPEGDLLALSDQRLWHLRPQSSGLAADMALQTWALPLASPEWLSAWWAPAGLTVAVFDEEVAQLYTGLLPLKKPQAFTPELIAQVPPVRETPPARQTGDAMDDPAIWVNEANPLKSRVLGTHKKSGLYVYDLDGQALQFLPDGRLNNVDVRNYGLRAGLGFDLAVASKRDDNSVLLYGIDNTGQVQKLASFETELDEIYGICMGLWDKQHQVFVNDKDGRFQQYQLTQREKNWHMTLVRQLKLDSQPEGCAFDDQQGRLFVGEEGRGIWTLSLKTGDRVFELVAEVGDALKRDVEGMAIAHYANDESLLVVSSQGNDSYLLYDTAPPYAYRGRFRVGLAPALGVDGSSETDGLDVTTVALGADFPAGLLVLQDGRNLMPSEGQNFKLVSWRAVLDTLELR